MNKQELSLTGILSLSKKGKRLQSRNGFTLVELIVVITILAILGTIAFISLQGYSSQSRDSVRISDISSIKTSLELFNLEAGKYPLPTSGVDITYSGAIVWNQGIFGKTVYVNVSKLDKIPLDPTTDKEYTYSVNSNRYEYQLGGIVEGDVVATHAITTQTNAGETTATAYITGNYNGLMTKSNSGTTCNVLSIPTIITNDTTVTDLQQIVTNNAFVYRGYKNLPASFKISKFKYNGGFSFTPNNLIAYTDTGSCTALTSNTSSTARVNLLKGLQDSYSGTTLKNEGEIKNIVGLSINTSSPSDEVITYAGNFVNNVLGGSIIVSGGGQTNPVLTYQEQGLCNQPDITIGGITIAACNVGTTTAGTGATSYGKYFQWGNNYGSVSGGPTTATLPNASGYNPPNYYTSTAFIIGSTPSPYYDWTTVQNDNLWGDIDSSVTSRQGPCGIGYHIPSIAEWVALKTAGGWGAVSGIAMQTALNLPQAGYRGNTGGFGNVTYCGQYWSSTVNGYRASTYDFCGIDIYSNQNQLRFSGESIRCFKN